MARTGSWEGQGFVPGGGLDELSGHLGLALSPLYHPMPQDGAEVRTSEKSLLEVESGYLVK
ncbi:MAG: hypothetical protein AAF682_32100 [Planctomycetota bacterium]